MKLYEELEILFKKLDECGKYIRADVYALIDEYYSFFDERAMVTILSVRTDDDKFVTISCADEIGFCNINSYVIVIQNYYNPDVKNESILLAYDEEE